MHLKMHEKATGTGILLQSLQMSCGRAIFLQVSFAKFCQHVQKPSAKFGKTCLGRFGIGHLPWQNAPYWDRKTRGDFHWLSRSAKRASEERPTCGRTMKNLHSAVDWTTQTHTHILHHCVDSKTLHISHPQFSSSDRAECPQKEATVPAGSDQSVRVSPARLQDLALQWTFWVSKSFKHLFQTFVHILFHY